MAIPTTHAALTAYIEKNPHLDQITVSELAQGLTLHFQAHDRLRRSVAAALGMSRREQQWPQLVAKHYAVSLCGCPALAQVLLTGGYVAYPEAASLFCN
jgi:hypothetical protein